MRASLLTILRCPTCKSSLSADEISGSQRIDEGTLSCTGCWRSYPVVRGIPRFVAAENYTTNFGLQWNTFRSTQLDSVTGKPISRRRFCRYTGWDSVHLKGQLVLDAGCGAGRFAEVALSLHARVIAVDFSNAIDAARENLEGKGDVEFIQADINALPFASETFPFVYCLGVIQHTPDPGRSFEALADVTAPDGRLAIDVYPRLWRNALFAKYWIRPLTKRISPSRALRIVRRIFPFLYPVSSAVSRIPWAGHYLRYLVPVVNYQGVYDLSEDQLREWALLDTFDMWSPAYDQPQTKQTISRWFTEAGFSDLEIFRDGFLVGRGVKRGAS